jgi:hypothetical protein
MKNNTIFNGGCNGSVRRDSSRSSELLKSQTRLQKHLHYIHIRHHRPTQTSHNKPLLNSTTRRKKAKQRSVQIWRQQTQPLETLILVHENRRNNSLIRQQ